MHERPELLAPAGSPEALKAAIAAGADAVYLGYAAHSARASAGFTDQELGDAIHLAHLYGRRVYVTVNTLVKQRELEDVRRLLRKLDALQVDAVLVQDLGVLKLIKEEVAALPVHASTQMSVHNALGARMLLSLGVSRVVLAREASLETIRQVAATGIETEVFVHGALCVSVSGQCLFSSHIGGRSGNRGRCAQPCRLYYSYKDMSGALLSMRDLNTLKQLPRLADAGVGSFKIEGRLKRPEYVYIVTSIYKRALDRVSEGLTVEDKEADQAALIQIFSRGFTAGHAFMEEDARLIRPERVSHEGVKIGKLVQIRPRDGFVLADILLDTPLHDQDGLQVRGTKEQELIYSGPQVPAGQTATLRLRESAGVQDEVWRLADEAQLSFARKKIRDIPKTPFDAILHANPGERARLLLESRGAQVQVLGDTAQAAEKQPLNDTTALPYLNKTGNTPFTLQNLRVVTDGPSFLPASSLNALRREGLQALEDRLASSMPRPAPLPIRLKKLSFPPPPPAQARLYALIGPETDRGAVLAAGADQIIFAPDDYRESRLAEQLKTVVPLDIISLPRQISDKSMEDSLPIIQGLGCTLMLENIGQLALPHTQPFVTGEGVPVWNEQTIRLLHDAGAKSAILSRELTREEIEDLPVEPLELILPVYGRAQLMQLFHCPERMRLKLSKNRSACALCDTGAGILGQCLTDRFHCAYPLTRACFPEGCTVTLLHHKALHLASLAPKMSWLMDLRHEGMNTALEICRYYAALKKGETIRLDVSPEPGRFQAGVL